MSNNQMLFEACRNGQIDEVKKLLERGKFLMFNLPAKANVNAQNEAGLTPLYIALDNRHKDIAEFLILKGANLNFINKNGFSLLVLAVNAGKKDIAEFLIDKSVDVNAKNNEGLTPLYYAITIGIYNKKDNVNINIMKLLIDRGADVNARDKFGQTLLHYAIMLEHDKKEIIEIIEMLIDKGADVNAEDRQSITPLYHAAKEGNKKIVGLLIERGAEINKKDYLGNTLLQNIIMHGYGKKEIIETLIDKGANINAVDGNGLTPLYWAATKLGEDIIELLIAKGAKLDAMGMFLLVKNRKDAFNLLIAKGADINAKDNNGNTILMLTAMEGLKDVVEFLIAKGADVNIKNNNGNDVLQYASQAGHKDIVNFLISKGAGIKDKKALDVSNSSVVEQGDLIKTVQSHFARIRSTMTDVRMKEILDEAEKCFLLNNQEIKNMVNQTTLDKKLHTKSIEGGGMKTWLIISAVPVSRFGAASFFASEYPPGYCGYMNFWFNSQLARTAVTIGQSAIAHLLIYSDRSVGLGLAPLELNNISACPKLVFPEESLTPEDKKIMGV